MAVKSRVWPVLAMVSLLLAPGCSTERDTSGLQPLPRDAEPVVFADGFSVGLDFQAFLGSYLTALSIDTTEKYSGTSSLKFTVPLGTYAGGAFPTTRARDLTGYDALTFWAKASRTTSLDIVGLGNDNTDDSRFKASRADVPLTTEWTKVVVPIPLPAKLTAEDGLFFLADGDGAATAEYSLWFDEVRFERLGTVTNPRPAMRADSVQSFAGVSRTIRNTRTTFDVGGMDVRVDHDPGYFTFLSSNPSVAEVTADGTVRLLASGTAAISAMLGNVSVAGTINVDVRVPDPTGPAPAPTRPAVDVVSLFSNAYPAITVSEWSTTWDTADVFDLRIAGDDVKVFQFDTVPPPGEPYVGIDFQHDLVNAVAAGMTHLHLDVWIPGAFFSRVKLVDFGSDGIYTGGDIPDVTPCDPQAPERDISQHSKAILHFDPGAVDVTTAWDAWIPLDIPLADFQNADFSGDCIRSPEHLAQIILAVPNEQPFYGLPAVERLYLDNLYFYR
jgi:hypothetical protein